MCGAMTAERTQKVVYVKDEAQGLVLSLSKHGRRRLAVSGAGEGGIALFISYERSCELKATPSKALKTQNANIKHGSKSVSSSNSTATSSPRVR